MIPHAVKRSSIDGKTQPVEFDVENPFVIPAASESRLGKVFYKDMVFLDLKFSSPCKHSLDSLCRLGGFKYSMENG